MTRYGGLGRTRPKASIPIVREEEIDALDEDIQNHQQIETGVEKAEESVSLPISHSFSLTPVYHVIASPKRHEIFTMLTACAYHRNFTCKSRSTSLHRVKSTMRIFLPPKPSSVIYDMTNFTHHSFRNPRPTSAPRLQSRTAVDVHTT